MRDFQLTSQTIEHSLHNKGFAPRLCWRNKLQERSSFAHINGVYFILLGRIFIPHNEMGHKSIPGISKGGQPLSNGLIAIQQIIVYKMYCVIYWVEIYPGQRFIQGRDLSSNRQSPPFEQLGPEEKLGARSLGKLNKLENASLHALVMQFETCPMAKSKTLQVYSI